MLTRLLILLGKTLSFFIQTLNLGSGSTWPGNIALKINKNFIHDLLKNSHTKIVLIAGTNGKTTTGKLIQHILETDKKKVFQNEAGANLLNGVASTLLQYANVKGKIDADFAIFEVDENALPEVTHEITPDFLILLNIFRDQLDRYGETSAIVAKWTKVVEKLPQKSTLILNADDPEISFLGTKTKAKVLYFGLDDKSLSQTTFQHASDSLYCPKCGEKLLYKNRYFSHLGDWSCSSCGNKRPNIDQHTALQYPLSGVYNMYNTLAAVLQCRILNIEPKTIDSALHNFTPAFGRQEIVTYKERQVQLFLSKNPTSANQSLRTIKDLGAKNLLFILNDQIPDGRDVSWIWDVDFEEYLQGITKITITGDRCFDLGLRVKYAQIPNTKYQILSDLQEAIDSAIQHTAKNETLYILPTYSAMLDARKILTGKKIL